MLALVFLFIQIGFFIFTLFLVIAFVTGAPFVPSTNPVAEKMIALAHLKKGMKIYDLGSGDGKLLLASAQQGATAVGLEINPLLVVYATIRAFFTPHRSRIKTVWKNFWSANLTDADVVFVYLLPWRMEKLERILKKQLKPGAVVISNSFIFPNWPILRQDKTLHVYAFRIGKTATTGVK